MPFKKSAPQFFDNTEGFRVQIRSREAIEYIEGARKAIVGVEFGLKETHLYKRHITGWLTGDVLDPMSESEKTKVLERVAAALQFDGAQVDVVP